MTFFIGSEERARHKSVDKHLDATRALITDPVVSESLKGYASASLRTINEQLFVPNIRHGVALAPRDIRMTDKVPVIAISREETITVDPDLAQMGPRQQAQYLAYIESQGATRNTALDAERLDEVEDARRQVLSPSQLRFASHTLAFVNTPGIILPLISRTHHRTIPKKISFRSAMVLELGAESAPLAGSVGLHETVHVMQEIGRTVSDASPERITKSSFEDELEAYHVEAVAGSALYNRSPNALFRGNLEMVPEDALRIDTLRAQENARLKNAFEPTGKLRNLIRAHLHSDIVLEPIFHD